MTPQAVANCADGQQALARADVRRRLVLVEKRREDVKTVEIALPEKSP